jgi:hypothetical protein
VDTTQGHVEYVLDGKYVLREESAVPLRGRRGAGRHGSRRDVGGG